MNEQWQELKETITEMRDNDGTGTQQEVCKFLANYMDILEKQMVEPTDMKDTWSIKDVIDAFKRQRADVQTIVDMAEIVAMKFLQRGSVYDTHINCYDTVYCPLQRLFGVWG